jgi:hypothetical protein
MESSRKAYSSIWVVEASRSCHPVFASGRSQMHVWLHHCSVVVLDLNLSSSHREDWYLSSR